MVSILVSADLSFFIFMIVSTIATGLTQIKKNNGFFCKYILIPGLVYFLVLKLDFCDVKYFVDFLIYYYENLTIVLDDLYKHLQKLLEGIPFYTIIEIVMSVLLGVYLFINSEDRMKTKFDFYGLIMFAFLTMLILIECHELHIVYICLEIQAFIFYTLIAGWQIKQTEQTALEGSLKYFMFGNLAGSSIIMGSIYIYSQFAVFDLEIINAFIMAHSYNIIALWVSHCGFYLIFMGLMMKLGFFPFHSWLVDAYSAASLYILLFLSVFPKVFLYYFTFSIQSFIP